MPHRKRLDPFNDSAWRWSLPGGGEQDALALGAARLVALNEGYTYAVQRANQVTVTNPQSAWFVAGEDGLARPHTSNSLLRGFPAEVRETLGTKATRGDKQLADAYKQMTGRDAKASIITPHGTGVLSFGREGKMILWHRDKAGAFAPPPPLGFLK